MVARQHKSRFYSSEGMRGLQAQIDELWRVVDGLASGRFLEEMEALPEMSLVRWDETEDKMVVEPMPGSVAELHPHDFDAAAHAATAEVGNALKPDAFQVVHAGRGWYVVVNKDGIPIHGSKLRKDAAEEIRQAAMEGA